MVAGGGGRGHRAPDAREDGVAVVAAAGVLDLPVARAVTGRHQQHPAHVHRGRRTAVQGHRAVAEVAQHRRGAHRLRVLRHDAQVVAVAHRDVVVVHRQLEAEVRCAVHRHDAAVAQQQCAAAGQHLRGVVLVAQLHHHPVHHRGRAGDVEHRLRGGFPPATRHMGIAERGVRLGEGHQAAGAQGAVHVQRHAIVRPLQEGLEPHAQRGQRRVLRIVSAQHHRAVGRVQPVAQPRAGRGPVPALAELGRTRPVLLRVRAAVGPLGHVPHDALVLVEQRRPAAHRLAHPQSHSLRHI
jgi:hypothetical protein